MNVPWPVHDRRFGRIVRAAIHILIRRHQGTRASARELMDAYNDLVGVLAERARRKGRIN